MYINNFILFNISIYTYNFFPLYSLYSIYFINIFYHNTTQLILYTYEYYNICTT